MPLSSNRWLQEVDNVLKCLVPGMEITQQKGLFDCHVRRCSCQAGGCTPHQLLLRCSHAGNAVLYADRHADCSNHLPFVAPLLMVGCVRIACNTGVVTVVVVHARPALPGATICWCSASCMVVV